MSNTPFVAPAPSNLPPPAHLHPPAHAEHSGQGEHAAAELPAPAEHSGQGEDPHAKVDTPAPSSTNVPPPGHLTALDDDALLRSTKAVAARSNQITAALLEHLAEVDAHGAYRHWACPTLQAYCVYELRMSEDAAQRRCRAARFVREFPRLLEMVADSSLHLTGLLLIGPHLTVENQDELLQRVAFRSKKEIEKLVAQMAPRPDGLPRPASSTYAALIESLYRYGSALPLGLTPVESHPESTPFGSAPCEATPVTPFRVSSDPVQSSHVEPMHVEPADEHDADDGANAHDLSGHGPSGHHDRRSNDVGHTPADGHSSRSSPEHKRATLFDGVPDALRMQVVDEAPRYRVQFTAEQEFVDLLSEARDLLRYELPSGDLATVQLLALRALVETLRCRQHAATTRASEPSADSAAQEQPEHSEHSERTRQSEDVDASALSGRPSPKERADCAAPQPPRPSEDKPAFSGASTSGEVAREGGGPGARELGELHPGVGGSAALLSGSALQNEYGVHSETTALARKGLTAGTAMNRRSLLARGMPGRWEAMPVGPRRQRGGRPPPMRPRRWSARR